ncbi:TPA: hypothetical protein N0F65_008917 [Lagenidium giganteum]|uniref:Uncharacterized protein n=1 Tax=Lagenidium giganteum TaxID=4803 RepID=A0AAV2YU37_9STRA|nr:TPA: hypothetical protein N0F65_008917 [Lagenidium giganteum]
MSRRQLKDLSLTWSQPTKMMHRRRTSPPTCCEWLKRRGARNARPCGMAHFSPAPPLQATTANACFRRATSLSLTACLNSACKF